MDMDTPYGSHDSTTTMADLKRHVRQMSRDHIAAIEPYLKAKGLDNDDAIRRYNYAQLERIFMEEVISFCSSFGERALGDNQREMIDLLRYYAGAQRGRLYRWLETEQPQHVEQQPGVWPQHMKQTDITEQLEAQIKYETQLIESADDSIAHSEAEIAAWTARKEREARANIVTKAIRRIRRRFRPEYESNPEQMRDYWIADRNAAIERRTNCEAQLATLNHTTHAPRYGTRDEFWDYRPDDD